MKKWKIILPSILAASSMPLINLVSCNEQSKVIYVESVTLDKPETTLQIGRPQKLKATVLPDNATDKSIVWESSDPTYVEVDDEGNITALKLSDNPIIITAKSNGGQPGTDVKTTCTVTVDVVHVESVDLEQSEKTGYYGEELKLPYTILPNDAANKNVTWESSNTKVATVDEEGLITCKGAGQSTITIESVDGGYSDTCTLNVIGTAPTEIKIVLGGKDDLDEAFLSVVESPQLTYTLSPSEAADPGAIWSSSNEEVATIDQNGNITPIKHGNTTITVTTKETNLTDTIKIYVENPLYFEKDGSTSDEDPELAYKFTESIKEHVNVKYRYAGDYVWHEWKESELEWHSESSLPIDDGQKLFVKNMSDNGYALLSDYNNYFTFEMTESFIKSSGDVRSMINWMDPMGEFVLARLFYNCNLLTIPPSFPTNYQEKPTPPFALKHCYYQTFYNCTSLKAAPYLPSKYLESECYLRMFQGCSSLIVNLHGDDDHLIFECPDFGGSSNPTSQMFEGINSASECTEATPTTVGQKYYWAEADTKYDNQLNKYFSSLDMHKIDILMAPATPYYDKVNQ